MQVIEQFITGKQADPSLCEDAIVVTDSLAAVIDGATDRDSPLVGGRKTGRFAADVMVALLASNAVPLDQGAESFFSALSAGLAAAMAQIGWPQAALSPVCTVTAYIPACRQVWRLGDQWVRIGNNTHGKKYRYEEASIAFRRALLTAHLAAGTNVDDLLADDPSRPLLNPAAPLMRHLMNPPQGRITSWSVGTVTSHPAPMGLIDVIDIPDGTDAIILASDGYPTCPTTLAEAEADLAHLLATDPLLISEAFGAVKGLYPGQSSFDDRAWLRLHL